VIELVGGHFKPLESQNAKCFPRKAWRCSVFWYSETGIRQLQNWK